MVWDWEFEAGSVSPAGEITPELEPGSWAEALMVAFPQSRAREE